MKILKEALDQLDKELGETHELFHAIVMQATEQNRTLTAKEKTALKKLDDETKILIKRKTHYKKLTIKRKNNE